MTEIHLLNRDLAPVGENLGDEDGTGRALADLLDLRVERVRILSRADGSKLGHNLSLRHGRDSSFGGCLLSLLRRLQRTRKT